MKPIRSVYSKVVSTENLYSAARAAARGRRYRETSADFNFQREDEIRRLQAELVTRMYRHGPYREFTIMEPKARNVAAAPFRDRVVHHAIHDVIEPMIDKTFVFDSYACRKGKGTHSAVDRAQHFLRANRFYLHGDIYRYFASIDHDVLQSLIEQRIQDPDLLWLVLEIVRSSPSPQGLPIGNLTSQFFANLYLNELDWYVKRKLGVRCYLRYMDDFLLLSREREELSKWKQSIATFLKDALKLRLHEGKTRIAPVAEGISFLGFRIFRNYRRLRSGNVQRFRERLHRLNAPSIESWVSHSRYANAAGLRRQLGVAL
jgi:retron-type reverse transcriptase